MIYTTCDVSGGHVNPAITLQFFLDTQISAARMVAYWGAQYSGAFSAAGWKLTLNFILQFMLRVISRVMLFNCYYFMC